jgi:hypothetical protein
MQKVEYWREANAIGIPQWRLRFDPGNHRYEYNGRRYVTKGGAVRAAKKRHPNVPVVARGGLD